MLRSDKFDPLQEAYEGGSPLTATAVEHDNNNLSDDTRGFGARAGSSQFWACLLYTSRCV